MSLTKGFLRLFASNSKRAASNVTDTNHQHRQSTIQRVQHRGVLIENSTADVNSWKAKVNGKLVTGDLPSIKESIDWWCDNKTEILHDKPANQTPSKRKIEVYQGLKIINDSGRPNEWYMLHNGQLLKGTKKAIEAKIDIAIEKSRRKRK